MHWWWNRGKCRVNFTLFDMVRVLTRCNILSLKIKTAIATSGMKMLWKMESYSKTFENGTFQNLWAFSFRIRLQKVQNLMKILSGCAEDCHPSTEVTTQWGFSEQPFVCPTLAVPPAPTKTLVLCDDVPTEHASLLCRYVVLTVK